MSSKSVEHRLSELETRVAKLEVITSRSEPRRTTMRKKVSPKEFLLANDIKTELQKTLALAYYLETQGGVSSFNTTDLIAVFQAAKEKRPGNLSDTVGKNVARGFLMEAPEKKDNKKAWTLTITGEKYVEQELSK